MPRSPPGPLPGRWGLTQFPGGPLPDVLPPPADDHRGAVGSRPGRDRPADAGPAPGDHDDLRCQAAGHWPNFAFCPVTPITTPRGLTLTECTVSPSGSAGICRVRSRIGASSAAGTPLEETIRRLISSGAVCVTWAMADASTTWRLALSCTRCGPALVICSPGTARRAGSWARLAKGITPVP